MKSLLNTVLILGVFAGHVAGEEGQLAAAPEPFRVGESVLPVLQKYCFSCHNADEQSGEVRLDNLESLKLEARLELLNRAHEQIFIGEMPPKNEKQPAEAERELLADWVARELRAHNASKLEDKLRKPEFGNVLDHDKLFSGKYKHLPSFTPDRRWLISEFIFNAKFNKLLDHNGQRDIDGKRYSVIGDNNRRTNLTNPFLLPTHSGVRYYDTTILDGGHLLTMLTNAKEVSAFMLNRAKSRGYIPALDSILGPQWDHEKILAARESYLKLNIEQALRELYPEKHDRLLPVFVASKYTPPPTALGADGKPLKKPVFDTAKPSNEELDQIWSGIRKHAREGVAAEELILKCEQDWFHYGVNERTIHLRVAFMHAYMEDLNKKMPKASPVVYKPPVETELAALRAALLKHRQPGDTYAAIIAKCLAEWSEGFRLEREKTSVADESINKLVDQLFVKILERSPAPPELEQYAALTKTFLSKLGNEKGIERLIQTLILRTDFVYRNEFGEGEADEHGRKMLAPRDASYALAYALTDSSPDKELQEAVKNGRLNTREDYRREVERMLQVRGQYYIIEEAVDRSGADSLTNLPIRKLRFFREFFGYPAMLSIFKDNKRFGGNYVNTAGQLVSEADMLVELILKEDRNVIERLLTTEEFYVYHSGDNAAMTAATQRIRKIYEHFKELDWRNFDADRLLLHVPFLKENPLPGLNLDVIGKPGGRTDQVKLFKSMLENYAKRLAEEQKVTAPFSSVFGVPSAAKTRTGRNLGGAEAAKAFNLDLISWNYPTTQPARMAHRKGILTHPAWLIAFAGNTATDPIRRGKWVREKLLAGTIPDVPVTVDAVIPEDPHKTLRERLEKVTHAEYCWKCHERMNPLGTTFEIYDDFGRFRAQESLEHPENLLKKMPDKGAPEDDLRDIYKTLPVNAAGKLVGTGDPQLDGELKDALDLAERLGKSAKVRQSIIRHAFRYFMGRNELLSDSQTLMNADEAYVQSGGSFDAVIVSLLTSDSFIYRKPAGS